MEFDIGLGLMSSYDADGFLGTQYDADGQAGAGVSSYETHHPLGFMSRMLDPVVDQHGAPDPTQSCQVHIGMEEGQGHLWLLEDPRVVPNLPALRPGESLMYGCAGQFIRCHADGSITLMTTDAGGASSGKSVYLQITPTGLRFVAPWGKLTFDATGWHLLTQAGGRFNLGSVGGLPAPLDQISSFCNIAAGMVSVNGGTVSLGPTAGSGEPAPKGLTLLTYLQQLNVTIGLIAAAVSALAGVPANAAVGAAPAGTAAGAVAAQVAAGTALTATLFSSATVG